MGKTRLEFIEEIIQRHRDWLERWGATNYNDAIADFNEYLQDKTSISLWMLTIPVDSFGTCYGTRGLIAVLDGEEEGWPEIQGAIECYLWKVRLTIDAYYSLPAAERKYRLAILEGTLPLAVTLLAYYVASKDSRHEQRLWTLLRTTISDPDLNEWWHERRFEPFFVTLYGKTHEENVAFDLGKCDLRMYESLLARGEDDAEVAEALRRSCDYHLNRTMSTDNWSAEFKYTPIDLIPAEIFAINALRTQMGLNAIEIEHPLMNVIGLPEVVEPAVALTPILSRIQRKYNQFFQD